MGILEFIIQVLKIVVIIMRFIKNTKDDEKAKFKERLDMVKKLLEEITEGKKEVFDEDAYLSNVSWEEGERYKTYRNLIIITLERGGGWNEIRHTTMMGLGDRAEAKKAEIIKILGSNLYPEAKSIKISMLIAK